MPQPITWTKGRKMSSDGLKIGWIKYSIDTWCSYVDGSDQQEGTNCPCHKQKMTQVSATKAFTFLLPLHFALFLMNSLPKL